MGGTAVHHVHQLVYCQSSKRWHAYKDEAYCCPIHCGDSICIRVEDAISWLGSNATPSGIS